MNQNFANTEREMKVAVVAGEQVTISVGSYALLVEKLCTPILNFLHIQQQKYIQLYSVPAKKKWNISETLRYYIYGAISQIFDGIYTELGKAIYYNIFRIVHEVFDKIFDGI